MSNSPTAPTSTTASSNCSDSRAEPGVDTGRAVVIACGAIAQPIAELVRDWTRPVDVHPLPPLLHNHPERIADEVEQVLPALRDSYDTIVIGYADCGTYGALDEVCARHGIRRLDGLHCYDVYGGTERVKAIFEAQPGTYVLTDFLVQSFARTVVQELGLDRHPELHQAYFAHYTSVVWLAQRPTPQLRAQADASAAFLQLPLTIINTGLSGLEQSLRNALRG